MLGGRRVSKNNQRVVAYGTVDELNSQLGFAESLLSKKQKKFSKIIFEIQTDLWEIEAELATSKLQKSPFVCQEERVKRLERTIDKLEEKLPPLQNFIFPGGSQAGSSLHVARTICRRAEREVVALSKKEKVNPNILSYLNRLSDLLFVLARSVNKAVGAKETKWKGRK